MNGFFVNICWGVLILLAFWTLTNVVKYATVFVGFFQGALVVWLCIGVVSLFASPHLTFMEWFGGAGIVCLLGCVILFNLACTFFEKSAQWEHNLNQRERERQAAERAARNPATVTHRRIQHVWGEVVEEDPQLNAHNPQTTRLLSSGKKKSVRVSSLFGMPVIHDMPWTDYYYCDKCKKPTWQKLPSDDRGNWNHTYVCDCGNVTHDHHKGG